MRYGFNTTDQSAAVAALLVYAVWRSRDRARFKITPDVWGQIERFTKASAKRARELSDFIEDFKPKLHCATIHPRAMAVGIAGAPVVRFDGGAFAELESERETQREFLTGVLADADEPAVLYRLYRNTALVILLVRERLERERPVGGEWPAVVTIGGESHRRRWLRWVDARERGLIRPAHRHWRPAERDYLIDHITRVPLAEIARRLGRTEKALVQFCWRERICATRQDLLTSGEAARVYGLTAQRLTALARAGRIPARRVPGRTWWLFEPPAPAVRLPESAGMGRAPALR